MKLPIAVSALAIALTGAAHADVTFQINPATGEVILINDDPNATPIAAYDIQVLGGAGTFDTDAYSPALGGVEVSNSTRVGEVTLGDALQLPAGQTSLGLIFTATNPGTLVNADFNTEVLNDNNTTLVPSSVTIIPEPGSLALLGLGGLALLRRRR